MKNFKFLSLSLLVLMTSVYNQSYAIEYNLFYSDSNEESENIEVTDRQILNYIDKDGTTVNSAITYFQNPDVTRGRIVNILRSNSFIIDDICNVTMTKTVHDSPKLGFLGTIQYHLKQNGLTYSDSDVKRAIRKLYY